MERNSITVTFRRTTLLGLLVALVFAGCRDREDSTSSPAAGSSPVPHRVAPAPPQEKKGPIHFRDMAHEAGITFQVKAGTADKMWIPETMGQGVVLFDYDGDGDLDLYFANGGQLRDPADRNTWNNSLWRNDGNWHFTDVTAGSGLECPEWSCGTYAVDYDQDGYMDVFVTQLKKNRMFRNLQGSGRFEDVTDKVGLGHEGWSTSAAFFDADQDGDLDLYVCNYLIFDTENPPYGGNPCEWRKLKVSCGPRGLIEGYDIFYELKDGRFIDATERFGFLPRNRQGKPHGAYSLGVVATDLDRDGDVDVYVAVDSRPNLLFENLGGGKFREVSQEWQTARNVDGEDQAGMGVASADLNDDLMPDLFVTNFSHDTNTLYLNAGDPKNMFFDDRTSQIGLGGQASFPWLSWGIGIHDFNLDGLLDIFVASGHVYPQADDQANLGTSYAQPNQLYIADAPLRFRDRAREAGHGVSRSLVSRTVACADFDLDGRIDIVVTNNDSWPQILRNECAGGSNWWGFFLRTGKPGNPQGIGASMIATTSGGRRLLREITGGGSYQGQGDFFIHFALKPGEKLAELVCRWPDGTTEAVKPPRSGAWWILTRGKGLSPARP